MKKLSILLLILILVSSLFSLTGCKKSVDLTGKITMKKQIAGFTDDGCQIFDLICKVDPDVLDLRDATEILVKIGKVEYTATLPNDLNGTDDHNYFIIKYTCPDDFNYFYHGGLNVTIKECKAYISDDKTAEQEPGVNQGPRPEDEFPVWSVILMGVCLLLLGPGIHIVGVKVGVEIFEKPALCFVPHFVGLFGSVVLLIATGWLRALIMFGFYIVYFIIERVIDDKLGYDITYF